MLNCCSEFTSVFVTDAEMNDEDDMHLTFILFHHNKNISSCYFHKQLFPEHEKMGPSCMNIKNVEKGRVTTRKKLVLKSCSILDFWSEY